MLVIEIEHNFSIIEYNFPYMIACAPPCMDKSPEIMKLQVINFITFFIKCVYKENEQYYWWKVTLSDSPIPVTL